MHATGTVTLAVLSSTGRYIGDVAVYFATNRCHSTTSTSILQFCIKNNILVFAEQLGYTETVQS
jgi:hypothetical protein